MSYPIIILGAGGHAKVLADALRPMRILGYTDSDPLKVGLQVLDLPVLGGDDVALAHAPEHIRLINGLGSIGKSPVLCESGSRITHRTALFQRFKAGGYRFLPVIHPSAVIAPDVILGEGAQIMAGAVVQAGCIISDDTIINTRASVDHDCRIGAHVHIAPGAILSGDVSVGDHVHIGAGATIIQGICIGAHSVVAAGAVVIGDVAPGTIVMGVPAKEVGGNE